MEKEIKIFGYVLRKATGKKTRLSRSGSFEEVLEDGTVVQGEFSAEYDTVSKTEEAMKSDPGQDRHEKTGNGQKQDSTHTGARVNGHPPEGTRPEGSAAKEKVKAEAMESDPSKDTREKRSNGQGRDSAHTDVVNVTNTEGKTSDFTLKTERKYAGLKRVTTKTEKPKMTMKKTVKRTLPDGTVTEEVMTCERLWTPLSADAML